MTGKRKKKLKSLIRFHSANKIDNYNKGEGEEKFKPIIIFSTFSPLFAFPTVLFPFKLIFNIYKYSLSTSI